ncbi:MAG TPA: head-tail connector protein [Rhizomicrobium sp.]
MPLTLTTPPAIEPVTLAEAKAHLKVDTADDDVLIAALIAAARARAEWHTGRALVTQGWTLHLDGWPQSGIVEIPLPPLQSVASATTFARDDSATVLSASRYTVDAASAPARLALKPGVPPPTDLRRIDAVAIAFTAGYGDAASDVPPLLKAALLELIAFLYENRGEAPAELPLDCLALLAPYRVLRI